MTDSQQKFINCAYLIRSDCQIWGPSGLITADELKNRENFIDHEISAYLAKTPGAFTVFIALNEFSWIVPLLRSIWRAGGNVFVHDYHSGYANIPEFKNFYDFIHIVVRTKYLPENFADKKFTIDIANYKPHCVYPKIESSDVSIDKSTIAVKTHSSGTTGMPKIIAYTHEMVRDLTDRLILFFDFKSHEKPLHFKTLHHGSLFLNYAIPLLHLCRDHWYIATLESFEPKYYFDIVLPLCKKNQLTRILIPYDWLVKIDQSEPVDLDDFIHMHVIRGAEQYQMEYIFQNIRPKSIIDIFGCSEIGAMFIEIINKENYREFIQGKFSRTVPDLEYTIHPTFIRARWPNQPWQTIGDIFQKHQDTLQYIGRSWSIIIDDEVIGIDDLTKFLGKKMINREWQLVPDFKSNYLYLAIFDDQDLPDLIQLNIEISKKVNQKLSIRAIKHFDLNVVQAGMKPSSPILLYAFIKDFDNETTSD